MEASAEKFSDEFAASDEWASLLLSSQDGDDEEEAVFSKFHAHFAGRSLLSTRELVVQAKAELDLTKGWSEREAGLCHEKLLDALPAMSLAIKEKALRRRNFSPTIAGTGGGTLCFGTLFSGVLVPELAKSTTGGGADSAPSFLRSGVSTTVWESKGKFCC